MFGTEKNMLSNHVSYFLTPPTHTFESLSLFSIRSIDFFTLQVSPSAALVSLWIRAAIVAIVRVLPLYSIACFFHLLRTVQIDSLQLTASGDNYTKEKQ